MCPALPGSEDPNTFQNLNIIHFRVLEKSKFRTESCFQVRIFSKNTYFSVIELSEGDLFCITLGDSSAFHAIIS